MLKVYREWQEQNCSVFWCEANHVQYETLQDASISIILYRPSAYRQLLQLIYDQVRSRTRKDEIQLTSCGEDVAPIQSVPALCFAEKAAYYAERRRYVWLADDHYDVCTGEESSLHDREIGPDNRRWLFAIRSSVER